MTRKRWMDFCRELASRADHRDEVSPEVAGEQLGTDELEAWYAAESIGPHQTISDALDELTETEARLLIDCLLSGVDSAIPGRLLRDALRQGAIREAVRRANLAADERAAERPYRPETVEGRAPGEWLR